MSNTIGKNYRVTVFGQSHSDAMGVVIDGLPSGIKINTDLIRYELDRRKPGQVKYTTKRKEEDDFKILSGLVNGFTCGAPIAAIIENKNTKSKDYSELKKHPRPSHADFPAYIKYKGMNDINGGGQFSGRLTAPLTIAGAIAEDILNNRKIYIISRIKSIYNIKDKDINIHDLGYKELEYIKKKKFPVLDDKKGEEMIECIEEMGKNNDSVGGIVETFVFGLPIGVGEPLYDSVESKVSAAVFGIPGVRGIEFGTGFEATKMYGSSHNDEYFVKDGKIKTKTNHHGGVIGGLTTGMPLVLRTAIKPTSSIGKSQKTIDLDSNEEYNLEIKGRHDPCIVPRAVPAIEMAVAVALLDLII